MLYPTPATPATSLLLLTLSLISLKALATETDALESPEPKLPPYWESNLELGSVATSGNTDTSSLNGKFDTLRKGQTWDFGFKLEAFTSKDQGETSNEKYYTEVQLNRNFTEHSYLAMRTDYEQDRFSGYDYQTTASVGLGYRAIDANDMHLDLEAAPGHRRDRVSDGPLEQEGLIRLSANYSWGFETGTEFTQLLITEQSNSNSSYKSETGMKSRINGHLATKLAYTIEHNDQVPEGTENTNSTFSVTFVYGF